MEALARNGLTQQAKVFSKLQREHYINVPSDVLNILEVTMSVSEGSRPSFQFILMFYYL